MLNRDVGSDCDRLEPILGAFHDGELAAATAERVAAHLVGCAGCSARLAALRAVDDALARVGESPAVDLVPAVMAAVRGERRRAATWRLAAAAALLLASGLGAVAGSVAVGPRPEPAPPALVATLDSVSMAFAPAPAGVLGALTGDLVAAGEGGRR